jgi:hypothetical protein
MRVVKVPKPLYDFVKLHVAAQNVRDVKNPPDCLVFTGFGGQYEIQVDTQPCPRCQGKGEVPVEAGDLSRCCNCGAPT